MTHFTLEGAAESGGVVGLLAVGSSDSSTVTVWLWGGLSFQSLGFLICEWGWPWASYKH
jgi:hypothetical protein